MFNVGDKVKLALGTAPLKGQDENWTGTVTDVQVKEFESFGHLMRSYNVIVDDYYLYLFYYDEKPPIELVATTLRERISGIYIPQNYNADSTKLVDALNAMKSALLELEARNGKD